MRRQEHARGLIAALVPTAFFLVAFLFPIIMLGVLSFRPIDEFNNTLDGWTIAQYSQVFGTSYMWGSIVESLKLAAAVSVTCAVLAYPLAWYLARTHHNVRRTIVFVLVLSPLLTSEAVRALAWRVVMGGEGPVNVGLQFLGLTDSPIPLLISPFTVYLAVVHVLLPFAVISLTTTLSSMDEALIRASSALGASKVRTFFKVILPLSIPGLSAGMLIVFSLTMGIYVTPLMVGGANQGLAGLRIRDEVMVSFNQPLGAALSFALLIVTLLACAIIASVGRLSERGPRV